jgi:succinate dehydrogenase/fumarate reductase flavoprotein subunit
MKQRGPLSRYEEWFLHRARVLDDDGECCGVVTRNVSDGSMELFRAKER